MSINRIEFTIELPPEANLVDKESLKLMGEVLSEFSSRAIRKWIKGHIEHGGGILRYSCEELLEEAIDENIDQMVYLMCIKKKFTLTPLLE